MNIFRDKMTVSKSLRTNMKIDISENKNNSHSRVKSNYPKNREIRNVEKERILSKNVKVLQNLDILHPEFTYSKKIVDDANTRIELSPKLIKEINAS